VKRVLFERLFDSFKELDSAIHSAKRTLEKKDTPPKEVLDRIRVYEEMVEKQRALATALAGHVTLENWSEVSRHIQLINGFSTMIRDDAREILADMRPSSAPCEEREVMLC